MRRGQSYVEYALVVAILTVALIVPLKRLAMAIAGAYGGIGGGLRAPQMQVVPEKSPPPPPAGASRPAGPRMEAPEAAEPRSPAWFGLAWLESLLLLGLAVGVALGVGAAWIWWLERSNQQASDSLPAPGRLLHHSTEKAASGRRRIA